MSFESWQSTIYGVIDDGQSGFILEKDRCQVYWDKYIPQSIRENLTEQLEYVDGDIVECFRNYENDNEIGVFALIGDCICADDNLTSLTIQGVTDSDGIAALGVYECCIFPWEARQLAEHAEKENITFERVTDTIVEHVKALFGHCPPLDDHTLNFYG